MDAVGGIERLSAVKPNRLGKGRKKISTQRAAFLPVVRIDPQYAVVIGPVFRAQRSSRANPPGAGPSSARGMKFASDGFRSVRQTASVDSPWP